MRKTKIVATIGPSCDSEEKIEAMISAGVNVFRFNMKHGDIDWHQKRMQIVEKVCQKLHTRVAMLIDLQGPEVRIASLPKGMTEVKKGESVWFVKSDNADEGISLDHPEILGGIEEGQVIYSNDGFLEFVVVEIEAERVRVEVVEGGPISTRKTVNFPGADLDFPALMNKDIEHLELAVKEHVDFVALSYVRSTRDIEILKEELAKRQVKCKVVAKIEHPLAVQNFDAILEASDAIMVARGDLGLEYPQEEVPKLQKQIVNKCKMAGKPVIVATQMMESMTEHPRPTRAEVSDVANAVYDGADAVMLSGETASGKYPVRAVQTMARIAQTTEEVAEYPGLVVDGRNGGQTAVVVGAAHRMAELSANGSGRVSAFVVLTETGKTAEYLSRLRPLLPILAISELSTTLDQLTLTWGVKPILYQQKKGEPVDVNAVVSLLEQRKFLRHGDKVIVVHGEQWGASGSTSIVRIQDVG